MASPLPLACRIPGSEPLRLAPAALPRPVLRLPVVMLVRSLAVIAALSLPVVAATLADRAHPAAAVAR